MTIAEKEQATTRLLAHLNNYQVQAVGFVNENKLQVKGEVDRHIGLLDDWLDAVIVL